MFAYKFELGVVAIVVACGCGHFGELRIGRREESERERKLKTKISLNLDKPSVFCLLYIWLFSASRFRSLSFFLSRFFVDAQRFHVDIATSSGVNKRKRGKKRENECAYSNVTMFFMGVRDAHNFTQIRSRRLS